ncbi:MAG: substrate-binding domain-containing protein [candidate division KSB1 bacterium]|nr:substrate-binding domain-containing protein [candidate division KSB1 bacterium]MDZ7275262.1 substrate-binding domain-containing protein [candidate division KSB1 bacterium]MDZ7287430.1 substrate-binding domain-containing protein [candidate division KSB1 bacterium]MDZ7299544.1 substrate-binding domain-containing protein [candidate division KSB1 bacterium]MDZ7309095.1 substrate-binding domain-containing protein [candidate division KSB1 bacterium]
MLRNPLAMMIRKLWPALVLAGLAGCSLEETENPTRGSAVMLVNDSHYRLMLREAERFHSLYPKGMMTVHATSTREAIVHLVNDSVNVIVIDRKFNEEEERVVKEAGLDVRHLRIAEDALAIITHKQNPITRISQQSLAKILRRAAKDWSEIPEAKWSGAIDLCLTGRNSGPYELLHSHFFPSQVDFIPNHLAANQNEVLRYVATRPRAAGVVSLSCLADSLGHPVPHDSTTTVRVLAVEHVDSTGVSRPVQLHQAYIYKGLYPLHYPVYFYWTAEGRSVATGFITFVASGPGQKIILDAGLVPATMPVRLVQLKQG